MKGRGTEPATQHAALCYRRTSAGAPQVLLITSRDTGRWVLPKGWPKKTESGGESAMRESWEEAGVIGRLTEGCAGVYSYDKTMPDGPARPCCVAVHVIEVQYLESDFPEKDVRRREWFNPDQAAIAVDEPELKMLLAGFDPSQFPHISDTRH